MVRAFLEGVAFDLKRTLAVFEESGLGIKKIYHVSGGAKGELWSQIKADIYERPVYTLKESEGSVLGAALMGGVGAGLYESPEAALEKVFAIRREYTPNRKNRGIYEDMFGVFCSLHDRTQPAFSQLQKIRSRAMHGDASRA